MLQTTRHIRVAIYTGTATAIPIHAKRLTRVTCLRESRAWSELVGKPCRWRLSAAEEGADAPAGDKSDDAGQRGKRGRVAPEP